MKHQSYRVEPGASYSHSAESHLNKEGVTQSFTYVSSSLSPPLPSSSLGCLLGILLPALEGAREPAGELAIEDCLEAAFRDMVLPDEDLPPSRACLRRDWPYISRAR